LLFTDNDGSLASMPKQLIYVGVYVMLGISTANVFAPDYVRDIKRLSQHTFPNITFSLNEVLTHGSHISSSTLFRDQLHDYLNVVFSKSQYIQSTKGTLTYVCVIFTVTLYHPFPASISFTLSLLFLSV
jgi:hypothetical protein